MSISWRPMPLVRVAKPFDHPAWLYELKHDGFRALAHVDRYSCSLVSRRGHAFGQWPQLNEELAHAVRAQRAVLDGEVVCLRPDGGSDFNALLFRREWPFFYAFDLLSLEGRDLRGLPLIERKARLREILPRGEHARLRYVDHMLERGRDLFKAVCNADAEGVVAKWMGGTYHADGVTTSWVKVKNPTYSQMVGRHELFERRRNSGDGPRRASAAAYRLDRAAAVGW